MRQKNIIINKTKNRDGRREGFRGSGMKKSVESIRKRERIIWGGLYACFGMAGSIMIISLIVFAKGICEYII